MAAHELRYLYRRSRDLPDARRRLHDALTRCVFSDVPELLRLARTLDAWREELLAYFTTGGVSNGPTEAINLLIKRICECVVGAPGWALSGSAPVIPADPSSIWPAGAVPCA